MTTLRTNALLTCLAFGALLSMSTAVQARVYKCVDAKGNVYYTQVPPRQCLGRPSEELSGEGIVTKRIQGTLTPEQKAARARKLKIERKKEMAEREQRRQNRALLSTYSSVKDIEDARARALKENEQAVKETEERIAQAEKHKKKLEQEKQFYVHKPLPPTLKEEINNNEAEIRNQRGLLEVKKNQVAAINAKYDKDKRRYLELTKASPAAAAGR